MPSRRPLFLACLVAALSGPSAALAQDIYAGAVYEAGSGALTLGNDIDTSIQSFVGLAGIRFPLRGPLYAGGEIERSFTVEYSDDGEIYSDGDGAQRVRAVAGVDLSGISVFLSAGQARLETDTDTFSGASLGFGVEVYEQNGAKLTLPTRSSGANGPWK